MIASSPALVLIGFNKCGTLSLSDLFRRCGHTSAHWRTDTGQFLAPLIYANWHLKRPVLAGLPQYRVISDLFYLDEFTYLEANSLFDQMAQHHPQTRFLLNTRSRENWIASRIGHSTPGTGSLIGRACAFFRASESDVADIWRAQWDDHHRAVRDYFADSPDRLLVYDIETGNPAQIADWLGPSWAIDPARLRHLNRRTAQ
jgi:hypothetical protein